MTGADGKRETEPKPAETTPGIDAQSEQDADEETLDSSMRQMPVDDESLSVDAPDMLGKEPFLPTAFDRYEVRGRLGQGGFGAVYLGFDTQLNRKVAIKAPRLDADAKKVQATFLDEARQLAKLHHPAIVAVYDVGIADGQCYIVSNYLDGQNLQAWLRHHQPTWQESVQIVATIAQALSHAHAERVVHRDMKLTNIIMTKSNEPVLVDFGLALGDSSVAGKEKGMVSGTPAYMSPEQASGEGHRIDGRTDIYSLGVVLYRMLTQRMPFQSKSKSELLRQVREDEPQPPRQLVPSLPADLERICLKAMSKRIHHRFTTAGDMAERLLKLLEEPRQQHPIHNQPKPTVQPKESTSPIELEETSPSHDPAGPGTPSLSETSNAPHQDTSDSDTFASAGSSHQSRRESERRRVTLVQCSCDVFASEPILESLDTEEQQEVLVDFQQLSRQAADSLGGTVVQATTEGLLICFGYPVALEDSSQRAVRCGRELIALMDEFNQRLLQRHQVRLNASVAIHSDLTIVQDRAGQGGGLSIVGQIQSVINQLEMIAEPNTVVVSKDTHRLVETYFQWESLGMQTFKGVGKQEVFSATGKRSLANRVEAESVALTPLIGRDREVGLLQDRWEQATEGMGQVVLLIGEAGLGKSRLVHTLKSHVQETEHGSTATVIEWRASAHHHNSSLYPAIECLANLCALERQDSDQEKLNKLTHPLSRLNLDDDEAIALFASLLSIPLGEQYPAISLDPQRQKEKTIELLGLWLRELSYQSPVLFVIEDLHWVDPTTLEFLEDFVSQGLNDSILTLLTFRPEFVTPWQSMSHQTQIALNRLTRRQISEMVMVAAGHEGIPQGVVDQIIDRTDGVPLFVEEFTKMMVEASDWSGDSESSVSTSGNIRSHQIPATLQDLLMARLDRIDASIDVAQLGAAIGREFSYELISAVSLLSESDLQRELEKLVAAEILFARGRLPRTRYTFKHALIEDAAYGSLVKKDRQEFHRRIGEALESRFADVAKAHPELLAMHFSEAAMAPQAIDYWEQAGLRSLDRRAHKEAIEHLRSGLSLLALQPETPDRFRREIKLHTALGVPLQATIGYSAPEVEQTYARAHRLCTQLGLTTELFPVLYGMFRYYMLQAKYSKARELAGHLLEIANQTKTLHYLVAANRASGSSPVYEGKHEESIRFLNNVIEIEPTTELRHEVYRCDVVDPWIASRSYLSWANWLLGYPDRSLQHSDEAVRIAQSHDHSFSTALALSFSQWVHQFRRDVTKTKSTAEQALAISREHGFAFWYGWCGVMLGWTMSRQGHHADAIREIRTGISDWRAQGSELGCHYYFALLTEAYMAAGKIDEAFESLDEADRFVTNTGEGFYAPELPRLRGKLLLRQNEAAHDDAESCFRQAIELAVTQQSKSLELRAAISLAKLTQSVDELLPVYGWFKEGSDTHDLQRAKQLIEA